jgi:hypothetical protein
MLFSIRQELAAAIVGNHIQTYPALESAGRGGRFSISSAKANYLPGIGTYTIGERQLGDEVGHLVTLSDLYGKKRWATLVPSDEEYLEKNKIYMTFKSVAFELGLVPEENLELHKLYLRIEQNLLGEKINVPGTGFSFQKNLAIWVTAISVFFILVLIRNRIRQVDFNLNAELDEPWLILDYSVGLEKYIGICWLWLIIICPWIVNSGLFIRVVSQNACDGATFSLSIDLIYFSLIALLMTLSGWVSITTVSMILRVKNRLSNLH